MLFAAVKNFANRSRTDWSLKASHWWSNCLWCTLCKVKKLSVVFTALHCMQRGLSDRKGAHLFVCLSVCLSVRHTRELWQNKRKFRWDSYTVWKVNSCSFSDTKNGWWGTPPSTCDGHRQFNIRIFRYILCCLYDLADRKRYWNRSWFCGMYSPEKVLKCASINWVEPRIWSWSDT